MVLRVGAIISQSNPELHSALKAMSLYSYVSSLSDQITSSLLLDDAFTDRYITLNRERLSDAHAYFVQCSRTTASSTRKAATLVPLCGSILARSTLKPILAKR